MKLKNYIKKLQELEKKVGDVELIYGTDEEGNWFNSVGFAPSAKKVNKEDLKLKHGSIDGMNVFELDEDEGDTIVVCIN